MLPVRRLYSYFKNRFVMKPSTNGWTSFDCPFCMNGEDKKKGSVNFDMQFVKCWVCGFAENATEFIMQLEGLTYREAKALVMDMDESSVDLAVLEGLSVSRSQISDVKLPFGFTGLLDGRGVIHTRVCNVLEGRGFDLEVLDAMGFGYVNQHAPEGEDDYFGYYIIPFKSKGKLQYFIGRDFMDQFLRYKNPPTEQFGIGKAQIVFNEDALNTYKRCWVSEGWSDAMTMGKAGTSTQGWSLSKDQKGIYMRSSCEELVFVPDHGYYAKAVETAMQFIDVKKIVRVLNMDLITTPERKDANEIGYNKVYELYKETAPLTLESALDAIM